MLGLRLGRCLVIQGCAQASSTDILLLGAFTSILCGEGRRGRGRAEQSGVEGAERGGVYVLSVAQETRVDGDGAEFSGMLQLGPTHKRRGIIDASSRTRKKKNTYFEVRGVEEI